MPGRFNQMLLKKNIGTARIDYSNLHTVLLEVEAVVNSWPHTYLYPELEDGTVLTPSYFLITSFWVLSECDKVLGCSKERKTGMCT